MFEWLVHEMAKVKTGKFYLVDGPLRAENGERLARSDLPLPASYKNFILQFGNAKLYRIGDLYRVQVWSNPRADRTEKGEPRLCFGRTEDTIAYFKERLLFPDQESPVFEWHYGRGAEQQTADRFDEWLKKQSGRIRRYYTKKKWREIEKGPPPFSDREKSIVKARRKFLWRVVGIAPNGDLIFQVYNGSQIFLPYLSVGIRHKGGEPFGGVKLPVFDLEPGKTKVVQIDCYKDSHDPHKVEAFEEPDPGPEDRDLYWEFRATS